MIEFLQYLILLLLGLCLYKIFMLSGNNFDMLFSSTYGYRSLICLFLSSTHFVNIWFLDSMFMIYIFVYVCSGN